MKPIFGWVFYLTRVKKWKIYLRIILESKKVDKLPS